MAVHHPLIILSPDFTASPQAFSSGHSIATATVLTLAVPIRTIAASNESTPVLSLRIVFLRFTRLRGHAHRSAVLLLLRSSLLYFFSSLLRFFFNRYLRYLARGCPFRGYATIARNRFAESPSKTAAATPVLLKFTEQSKRPKFID
jgi:hypothetical protein